MKTHERQYSLIVVLYKDDTKSLSLVKPTRLLLRCVEETWHSMFYWRRWHEGARVCSWWTHWREQRYAIVCGIDSPKYCNGQTVKDHIIEIWKDVLIIPFPENWNYKYSLQPDWPMTAICHSQKPTSDLWGDLRWGWIASKKHDIKYIYDWGLHKAISFEYTSWFWKYTLRCIAVQFLLNR